MLLVRTASHAASATATDGRVPANAPETPSLDEVVRTLHRKGANQRAIARELNIDRRKIKRPLSEAA
jgi:ActR/RegA family two-component response regulator